MTKFRPKNCTIEAIQWHPSGGEMTDMETLWEFCPDAALVGAGPTKRVLIGTKSGDVRLEKGDWISRDHRGNFSVHSKEGMEQHYEEVKP